MTMLQPTKNSKQIIKATVNITLIDSKLIILTLFFPAAIPLVLSEAQDDVDNKAHNMVFELHIELGPGPAKIPDVMFFFYQKCSQLEKNIRLKIRR